MGQDDPYVLEAMLALSPGERTEFEQEKEDEEVLH
jgi:hypothetical protein